jgi:predicted nucleotidyltransferase
MDARPLLEVLAGALDRAGLEAILIGNAAAALQGAPVTTVDFDFFFRKTPRNLQKLKALAKDLDAVLMRPYYPVSGLYRLIRDEDGLQADFMAAIHGFHSFAELRAASERFDLGGHALLIAGLRAIVRSKRAARRPRDKAVLDILEMALHEKEARDTKARARGTKGRK